MVQLERVREEEQRREALGPSALNDVSQINRPAVSQATFDLLAGLRYPSPEIEAKGDEEQASEREGQRSHGQ